LRHEPGDKLFALVRVAHPRIGHLGAGHERAGIFKPFVERGFIPNQARRGEGRGKLIIGNGAGLGAGNAP